MSQIKKICEDVAQWVFHYRNIVLASIVAIAAIALAIFNSVMLPDKVGLNMLESGNFALLVDKSLAIWGSLAITAFCLLLVLISKKVLYPWLISLFSLVIPLAIWVMNLLG